MTRRGLEDRVMEYVDSEFMTHRIKVDKMLICQIRGSLGIYQTTYDLSKNGGGTTCSCPSEYWPCKHSLALAKTYEVAPDTFVDIKNILKGIQDKTKSELLEIIKEMIQYAPRSLSVLGIKGFGDDELEEDEE